MPHTLDELMLGSITVIMSERIDIPCFNWAMAAVGAGVARHRAGAAMDQERQGYESQLDQSQRQIEAQQRQIEALQQQKYQQPQHEDITQKLQKYSDLRQKGLLTEEEFQKLKANLLSQM